MARRPLASRGTAERPRPGREQPTHGLKLTHAPGGLAATDLPCVQRREAVDEDRNAGGGDNGVDRVDRQGVERQLLSLELRCANSHFFADQALDTALLHE